MNGRSSLSPPPGRPLMPRTVEPEALATARPVERAGVAQTVVRRDAGVDVGRIPVRPASTPATGWGELGRHRPCHRHDSTVGSGTLAHSSGVSISARGAPLRRELGAGRTVALCDRWRLLEGSTLLLLLDKPVLDQKDRLFGDCPTLASRGYILVSY